IAYAGHFDDAAAECQKALELDANHPTASVYLGQIEEYRGLFPKAIVRFRKAYDSTGSPLHLANLGHAYARNGNGDEARNILARLQTLSKTRYVSPYAMALVYIGMADKDLAFVWLQKAAAERSPSLTTLKVDPVFDDLRGDPRFVSLLQQMGL